MALVEDLHLDEDSVQDQMKVSNVYKLLGEYDLAIEALRKAIDALPKEGKRMKESLQEEIKKLEALRDGG